MLERPTHSRRRRAEQHRARSRRHRARVRACKACYLIEIDGEVINMLVQLRWIADERVTDKAAVAAAIGRLLAASARI